MNEKESNLSDKVKPYSGVSDIAPGHWIDVGDVKESIKRLKELAMDALSGGVDKEAWEREWNNLVGDKLI